MKLGRKGEDHPGSKLTENDVRDIRDLYSGRKGGLTMQRLGEIFGVSKMTISRVIRRTHNGGWNHV